MQQLTYAGRKNYDNPISFNDPDGDYPGDGNTNTVNSITRNKDGSYTINETLNSRTTTSSEKFSFRIGDNQYCFFKTTQELSRTETTTTIDATGKIKSTNSTTYSGVGTYCSGAIQELSNGTYINASFTIKGLEPSGDKWEFSPKKGAIVGPLARTAQEHISSMPNHSFVLNDDAQMMLNREFGDHPLSPYQKAAEGFRKGSKYEESLYEGIQRIRIMAQHSWQYSEAIGDNKLSENNFLNRYDYNDYIKNVGKAFAQIEAGKPKKKK